MRAFSRNRTSWFGKNLLVPTIQKWQCKWKLNCLKRLPSDHERSQLLLITEPTLFVYGRGTHILRLNFPLKTFLRLCFYSRIDLFLKWPSSYVFLTLMNWSMVPIGCAKRKHSQYTIFVESHKHWMIVEKDFFRKKTHPDYTSSTARAERRKRSGTLHCKTGGLSNIWGFSLRV